MKATLHTNKGDILVELFLNHAPKTAHNFVTLARGEHGWVDPNTHQKASRPLFDDTIFYRVISGFIIQGGDPLDTDTSDPGCQFDDEIHPELTFDSPYVLAITNVSKYMNRGTNGSQFFITVAPAQWLFGKHTIFGRVVDQASKGVVDMVTAVATGANDRPIEDVVIESVTISE